MAKYNMQHAAALLTYFEEQYQNKYNKKSGLNRNREKWNANEIVVDLGLAQAKKLIDYYFEINKRGHDFTWFSFNYDKLLKAKANRDKDREKRERMRQQTKERIESYKGNA